MEERASFNESTMDKIWRFFGCEAMLKHKVCYIYNIPESAKFSIELEEEFGETDAEYIEAIYDMKKLIERIQRKYCE